MLCKPKIKSVAVIGAGAAGAITAVSLAAEDAFDTIRVFERRESSGGTWLYDADPGEQLKLQPGSNPPEVDPPLDVPQDLPHSTKPSRQPRYNTTPIYADLTTNVPDIIMSFSEQRFAYGPFVPHWIPQQYIQNYISLHRVDKYLVLSTTVEDMKLLPGDRWSLTLRRHDPIKQRDHWWKEDFDAIVIANGHYSVPFIPKVEGLERYMQAFPGRVTHSKSYRTAEQFADRKVLIIGNSASGHDVTTQLVRSEKLRAPVYQSRRSKSRWDGDTAPDGIAWKPVIQSYDEVTGDITFEDGSVVSEIDAVIYCTGYKPSFPFWNTQANGGPLYDYERNKLNDFYQHTFSTKYPHSLAIVGIPRVLTFRSFEYQAVAIARLFAGRNAKQLPSAAAMQIWNKSRQELTRSEHRSFHTILWDNDETTEWFRFLYDFSGLPLLEGKGRVPPILDEKSRWAYDNIKKYPEPGRRKRALRQEESVSEEDWILVPNPKRDSAHFI